MSWHVTLSGVLAVVLIAFCAGSLAALSWWHLVAGVGLTALFLWHRQRFVEVRESTDPPLTPDEIHDFQREWLSVDTSQKQWLNIDDTMLLAHVNTLRSRYDLPRLAVADEHNISEDVARQQYTAADEEMRGTRPDRVIVDGLEARLDPDSPHEMTAPPMTPDAMEDFQREWRRLMVECAPWCYPCRGGADGFRRGDATACSADDPDIPDDTTLAPDQWMQKVDAMLREVAQRQKANGE